jgi:charged multivesicular body protein 7
MKTVAVIIAFTFTISAIHAGPSWNDLRVTFGINPLNTWNFDSLPRDLSGNMQKFVFKDDQCDKTTSSGKFLGQRYWYDSDPAVLLLFDKAGYIAGIQTSVPKSVGWTPMTPQLGTWLQDDGESYTLTVYFVDPSIICDKGRSKEDFASQGTGTGFYIQKGPNPLTDIFQVPKDEPEIKNTKWGNGKCFYLMGQHYWYNVTKNMAEGDFVPYCLLYNGGTLNAFCFNIDSDIEPSQRYEHPTPKAAECCIDPVPAYQKGKSTTMHVYMTSNYFANLC